jgi:hypothetical protein
MSNRVSTIERLNRNYKSLMGNPLAQRSMLNNDLRGVQAVSGLVNASPIIQVPTLNNNSVYQTVTTTTSPQIVVNASHVVPTIS